MDCVDTTRVTALRSNPPHAGGAAIAPASPALQADVVPALDIVFIDGFVAETIIGIDADEHHSPQPVRIDLGIGVPMLRACATDRIEDTINYAEVRAALYALLASHGVQLLEALAEKVAQLLIREFGAYWVRVSIAKPAKFDDVKAVGVTIERRRPVVAKG